MPAGEHRRALAPGGVMFENLIRGLTSLANGPAIAYLVGGSLVGMFLGVIPGLGGAVVLSIILALVYHASV